MSKVLNIVEIVVGVILEFVPGMQYFGTMLIVGGITGLAASYLAPGLPKVGRSDQNAPVQHISVDPDAYGTLVYGEAKCGGVMIYQNVCSSDGSQTYDILDYVVAHCFTDLTRGVEHMGAIYINDQLIPESSIDGSGNVTSGDFAGMVQVWRYNGTQTAADSVLVSAYGSDPDLPWPSTAIGKGVCYTHYRFKSGTDQDKFNRAFSGGPPNNVATVIKGEKPYDPRTSAYAYSENPAICLRDFMTRADNGADVPATYLDATILAASANICDEVITYPDGTTTGPRFKCDGAVGLGDSRKAIIGDILASMAGEVIQSNGLLSVRSGSYTPPSGTITEDFLSGAATSSEPTQDMRYNHVLTNYVGPKSNWQNVQAPAYPALSSSTYAAWLAQDGTRLDKQLGLKMVTNPENAQVIEQIVGNQSRYMRGVSLQCNAKALAFTTGDRVTLNIPECGEVNKTFKITGMRLRPDFGADVQLVADDSSIYGWDNVIAVDVPGLPLPGTKYCAPPVVTGLTCKPQADGIGISWDAPDVNKVDLTEVQRSTVSAGPFSVIYRGFSNSLVDHLPDDDSTYYYCARNYLGGLYSPLTPVQSQAGKIVSTAADVDARFAAIASDNILSAGEKPLTITSNTTIVNEQSGIDAQATAYGVTTEKTAYDNAVSALSAYLAGLTTPTAWNDVGGDTTIDGPTFRGKFTDVYNARQNLLNAIYAASKGLADTAQGTANTAISKIGNLANSQYLQNPFFSTGDLSGWASDNGSVYFESGTNGPASGSTSYAVFQHGTPIEVLRNSGKIPVYPGAVIKAQCAVRGVGSPNGVCGVRISWRGADDIEIGATPGNTTTGNAKNGTYVTGTAPAGAMFAHVECFTSGRTDTGGYYTVDNFAAWALADSLDQVPDGTTYNRVNATNLTSNNVDLSKSGVRGRTLANIGDDATSNRRAVAGDDIYLSGGYNRIGLRVAGSGHTVGDQRNLLPVTWAGVRSVNSTSPITYTYTWNAGAGLYNISANVAAYTLYAGTFSVSYAASSLSGTQAASTTVSSYYYYIDPTSSGGSLALHVTTNPAVLAQQNGIVFIGYGTLTTPAAGGGTGGGTGGGGGGFCVADEMFIGEGRRAGDAEIGDQFDCIDLPTAAGKHVRALHGVSRGVEECVRIITDDGCALVCSISTPFDLPDGRNTTAPRMLGEQVITDLGVATVISLALVGPRPVTRAHLGGVSYAAGADPHRRIYSHNIGVTKP